MINNLIRNISDAMQLGFGKIFFLLFNHQYTLKRARLKITQLEEVCLMKVKELELTQVELFEFFSLYMCCCYCIRIVLYGSFRKY